MTDVHKDNSHHLDRQTVRVVAATQGVGPLQGRSAEEVIAYAARVSSPQNQEEFNTASKLIRYCIKNEHWSIFEQASVTIEITTSLAIATQILRHRSFTFQQYSGRYAQMQDKITYKARRQDNKNRQNSIDDLPPETQEWFEEAQQSVWDLAKSKYDEAIANGIAKEQARFLLPQNTSSTLYMTGTVRSWIHYINLRSAHGTQLEHMDVANKCKQQFVEHFPNIAKALEWTG